MAAKTAKKSAPKSKSKTRSDNSLWGWSTTSLLAAHLQSERKDGQTHARVFVQLSKKAGPPVRTVEGEDVVEITLSPLAVVEIETDARLKTSAAVRVRDSVGASVGLLERMDIGWVEYEFNLDAAALEAALLGLEIALYRFKRVFKGEPAKLGFSLSNRGKSITE